MATGVPAGLKPTPAMTPAEGRKFGVTVGAAFLVITAILWWRGKQGAVPYVGGLGGALVLAGLLIPTWLGPVNKAWMGLAHLLSKITTPIFMGVIYFLVLTPIGLFMRAIGRHSLVHKPQDGTYWIARETTPVDPQRMQRQF